MRIVAWLGAALQSRNRCGRAQAERLWYLRTSRATGSRV